MGNLAGRNTQQRNLDLCEGAMMIRRMLLLGLVLITLGQFANAFSESSAITFSFLSINESDSSTQSTISGHNFATPDLGVTTQSEVDTDLGMVQGDSEIKQWLSFSTNNTEGFEAVGNMGYSFNSTNVVLIDSQMKSTGVFQQFESPVSDGTQSESLSVGLIDPGSNDYKFALYGNYNVTNTALMQPDPSFAPEDTKVFSISLESSPLLLEEPADFVSESANLKYWVEPEDIGILFSSDRDMEMGDTTFHSDVTILHLDYAVT
jgi:hypothetical protein